MLEIPKRATALDRWNNGEVICRRRRRCRPFERPGVPWVAACTSSLEVRPQQIGDKSHDSQRLKEHANRYNEIPQIPTTAGLRYRSRRGMPSRPGMCMKSNVKWNPIRKSQK